MNGPSERYRCDLHPRRWVIFRWWWPVPDDGCHLTALQSDSETEVLRGCGSCDEDMDES